MDDSVWIIAGLLLLFLGNAGLWIWWVPRYIGGKLEHFQKDLVSRHYTEVENMYRLMRGWRHAWLWPAADGPDRGEIRRLSEQADGGRRVCYGGYASAGIRNEGYYGK